MSDVESRLRETLTVSPRRPDESFVQDVERRVDASERGRTLLLALAMLAAIGLAVLLLAGLAALAPTLKVSVSTRAIDLVVMTAPIVCFGLVAALLSPLSYVRR